MFSHFQVDRKSYAARCWQKARMEQVWDLRFWWCLWTSLWCRIVRWLVVHLLVCVGWGPHEFRGKFGSPFWIITVEVILFCVYVYLLHINFKTCQFCIYLPSLLNMGVCNNLFFQWNGHNELSSSSNSINNNVTSLVRIAII